MKEDATASVWKRFGRFARLNPCFFLAILGATAAAVWGWPERPRFVLRSDRITEVVGRVSRSPECREGYLDFELRPESVRQAGRPVSLPGVVAVHLHSSDGDLCRKTVSTASYGRKLRIRAQVAEPAYFLVPGVADYRDVQWRRGVAATIRLKSPKQIEALEDPCRGPLLGPLFWYAESFRSFCRDTFSPLQNRVILSAFLGDKRVLEESDRERIRSLGAFHLFVVSGFHVSLVLAVFHGSLSRLGWLGRLAGLAAMWVYVAVTGAAPAAIRAGCMTTLFYLYLSAGLGRGALNGLGLTALGMLAASPGLVFDAGFQFSLLALAAIGLVALPWHGWIGNVRSGFADVWSRRISLARSDRLRRRIRFCLEEKLEFLPRGPAQTCCRLAGPVLGSLLALQACSVAIQLVTLPLGLFYSNRLVWTQAISNLLLAPLFSGFVVVCLLLFCSFWTHVATLIVPLTAWYADVLTNLLAGLEGVSVSGWWPHPGSRATVAYCVCLVIAWGLLKGWRKIWVAAVPGLLLTLLGWATGGGAGWLRITMLDVGQGEGIHIHYPNGESSLVDTGGLRSPDGSPSAFVGERLLGRYLWEERVAGLSFVLLSHPHVDHIQGLDFLKRVFPVATLLYHEPHESYRGTARSAVAKGDSLVVGGVAHRILHPGWEGPDWGTNDASVVMMLRYGDFSMLFTGDVQGRAERALLPSLGPVTVLKVPHHGGAGSCSRELLEAVSPQAALISAGRRNAFGHPSEQALERLVEADVPVFTTAVLGTLRVETDGTIWRLLRYAGPARRFQVVLERRLVVGTRSELTGPNSEASMESRPGVWRGVPSRGDQLAATLQLYCWR